MAASSSAQSVLITGCSEPRSLGDALARAYLKRGYTVFATARNISSMKALGEAGCHLIQLDVVNSVSIADAVKQVSEVTGGRLNILVNNVSAPVVETSSSQSSPGRRPRPLANLGYRSQSSSEDVRCECLWPP